MKYNAIHTIKYFSNSNELVLHFSKISSISAACVTQNQSKKIKNRFNSGNNTLAPCYKTVSKLQLKRLVN